MPAVGQCAICFSTLLSSETFAITKCGHTFHQNCIKQWIKTGKNCSSCRVKCSEKDVIKLFIQETNLDDTFSQQQHNPEAKILEMETKLDKAYRKLKKLADEKDNVEAQNISLNLQIREKDRKLKALPSLQLQVQNIHALEDEKAALQRQLKAAEIKLNASEFYDLLNNKGKGPDEYKKYVDSNGAIIDRSFMKLLSKERDSLKKRLDDTSAELKVKNKELEREIKKSSQLKELSHQLRAAYKDLVAQMKSYNDGNECEIPTINPKLKDIMNYSPERKKPRPSMGFSFESPTIPVDVLKSAINEKRVKKRIIIDDDDEEEDNENDTEYKPSTSSTRQSKPSPPKKRVPFSFESDDDRDWRPSSIPSTSVLSVPSPVARFTRTTSSSKALGSKFGTTIIDKRPAATKAPAPKVKTRSMDKYVHKSSRSSLDDSIVCLD